MGKSRAGANPTFPLPDIHRNFASELLDSRTNATASAAAIPGTTLSQQSAAAKFDPDNDDDDSDTTSSEGEDPEITAYDIFSSVFVLVSTPMSLALTSESVSLHTA